MKYRKKPIVIEAQQFTQEHIEANLFDGHGLPKGVYLSTANFNPEKRTITRCAFHVITIHGQVTPIVAGDWIMPEPDGFHHYPCKPDIFADSYEPVP